MVDRVVRTPPTGKPKLLDHVRDVIRSKDYSIRTEQAYIDWISGSSSTTANGILEKWQKKKSRNF